MSLALFVPGRPGAPRNGLYFRMENDNFKQRFKNGLRMEILGDVAYMVYPRSRAKKSYTLKLTPTDDASIIDWAPVDATWQSGRLEFACVEEVPGLLEDSDKFWKLEEEYPEEKVALRRSELQTQPSLALEDAMVTGNAAGTSAVRGGSALDWLGADLAVECMRARSGKLVQQLHRVSGTFGHGFQGNMLSSILLPRKGRLHSVVEEHVQTLALVAGPARERNET